MQLRVATLDDVESIAGIRHTIYPYKVASVAEQRHMFASLPEKAQAQRLVAEVGGRIVGFANAMLHWSAAADDEGVLGVNLLPGFRRRGIGAALLAACEEHLVAIGAKVVRVWGPDDEAAAGFAARHGYQPARSMRYSGLDPRRLPPMPPIPDGVELVTVGEAGIDAVYAFDCVASLDEPGDVTPEMLPLDTWVSLYWKAPDQQLDLGIMAMVDGICAAGTLVEADLDTNRSWSGFTGTRPDYRGRGLAKLVKSESLRRAAAAGITAAYTSNDAVNAPMLAVNTWLGYRPTATERSFNKIL
ncbi:N-acetyltransferase [Rhizocola hellebori]|uniref:N-acetyltransferase n=1 Tax=Rhizocola hellebori TaxID=1392758 RepID=A0A8J3VM91_9ACTN|nr:GNAT family N-acetyltransferase [Rhizocola hellebori]GIH11397.1 N-acetyltransferase [Rhizocola hellebori]